MSTSPIPPGRRGGMSRRDLRAVVVFVLVAYAVAWLIALPLWLGDGLASPWFPVVSVAIMVAPTIAALVTMLTVDRPRSIPRRLGIWPLRPVGRLLAYLALGLVVPMLLVLAALPFGTALGLYPADLQNFSAFRELTEAQLRAAGQSGLPAPIEVLVIAQLVSIPVGALLNMVPALGEELGWRGWLLPKLMPLGTPWALVLSGIIWGLWHAPVILLGYNYPGAPGWLGLLCMVGMCIVVGGVFGWLRLRSESVWPAALAHGAFNATAGAYLLFAQAGQPIDTTQATILGWSGWILPLALVVVLLATNQFRARTGAGPGGEHLPSGPQGS